MNSNISSGSSVGSSGVNRIHEVPQLNIVVEDSFQGSQNIGQQHPPIENLPEPGQPIREQISTVPKYYLDELEDYPEAVRIGGFGRVKKVLSSYIGAAALKTFQNIPVTDEDRRKWLREFENTYHLNHHPNIVGLYGYVYENTTALYPHGILMEYMIGGSLHDYLATNGHAVTDQIKNTWMKQIAFGLNFIHSLNLMHRDLKPDNIGNPVYSAPEVYMETRKYTQSADVWSYGMLLYFIFYLSHPYDPEVLKRIAPLLRIRIWRGEESHKSMNKRPILISDMQEIEYPIDTMIKRCWKTEPTERCTIREVVSILLSKEGCEIFPTLFV